MSILDDINTMMVLRSVQPIILFDRLRLRHIVIQRIRTRNTKLNEMKDDLDHQNGVMKHRRRATAPAAISSVPIFIPINGCKCGCNRNYGYGFDFDSESISGTNSDSTSGTTP